MLGLGLGVDKSRGGFGKFQYLSGLPSFVPSEYSLAFDASGAETLADYEANTLYFRDSNFDRVGATFSRTTTATRVNKQGLIESVAANVPRIDYTDGSAKLLMEPSRTNIILQSEDITTTWITTGAVVATDQDISPDGNIGANTLTGDGTNVLVRLRQGVSVSGSGAHIASCYFKKSTGCDIVRFRLANFTGASADVWFQLTGSGAVVSGSGGTIRAVGNDWYYCTVEINIAADLSGNVEIYAVPSAGAGAWASAADANGKEIFIWGAQLEAGSYPTSYIPTAGSTVTRNADSINNTSLGLTDCTFFINYVPRSTISGLLDFYNAANARQFYIAFSSAGFITFNQVVGGPINNVVGPLNVNEPIKLAFKLNASTGDLRIYVNGVDEGTFSTTISDINRFAEIASFGYVQNTLYDDIIIFPTQLTDTELAQLTS